ncbi:alpha/beta-Hydrolases superfamily protein [Perilla frutescens var. hirtella]|uniref:Alpha/beta-Hydrolases superfamily protein n=1 Tax=Perilla frutescens var. hirtella TaxID=608512 RepID=A0AAD4INA7_PERFH|nr:alpha/beta-Hydrolases superfamily protein [Perilla frutescens var. hirtella]KAH6816965.1 alpha/beta-Hydrolases superfamily protein [Perilla frutescens var. frutescens]
MSSANHEVRAGFELRVAALLADIVAASDSRRVAIVGAGGGAVVDWLLETVAVAKDGNGTQAESARALAYLIADPNVCEAVLGRPQAVPNLLRFIFSAQPKRSKKRSVRSSFDVSDKGKSMLVAAIMDVVTSNGDSVEKLSLKPLLPKNAEMRDIAAAIQVIEEGSMLWDEQHADDDDDDGGTGMKGIGMKVLGGTTVLGLSGNGGYAEVDHSGNGGYADADRSDSYKPRTVKVGSTNLLFNKMNDSLPTQAKLSSAVVPGLWDDLYSEHVAVPFAAWALANWAMASEVNRTHIQELDRDGHAVMSALVAPERSVKWHGSWLVMLLLEERNLPLNNSVSDWTSSLLSTISQASQTQDLPLAQVALSALLVAIKRSPQAQEIVMDKGLHSMREAAKKTVKHKSIQESLAKALELICSRDLHMSLEETQKWSAILLSWIFAKASSDTIRSSAINILSHILEDYGPSSVPISQGWLTILLTDALRLRKQTLSKGSANLSNDKVQTQIDQSNVVSATQTASQLSSAVVNLAGAQLGTATESADTFPLSDLLSLEPFIGSFKNLKKDKVQKITAADSAQATLKGIKALTEICAEDPLCQNKIADFGVLCLLRRLLLEDDYEQLAAIEAYDASRALEAQERFLSSSDDSSEVDNPSNLRVPATAHIRRHAARLLTILSVLPKVQNAIVTDKTLCKWLDECARGQLPGCNDLKIQSYARATLLNAFCSDPASWKSEDDGGTESSSLDKRQNCPRYADMIFLINPELHHWKCKEQRILNPVEDSTIDDDDSAKRENRSLSRSLGDENPPASTSGSESFSNMKFPPLDIVFVHGLRGGPFKTWRLSEDKSSTKSGLVEKIDEEAGKQGTFWPGEWLAADFPHARLFSLKYKTNLTQWSGASLPLQEMSSMLLEKLVAAGIGDRPVIFVTHSMGGLVVKQMLYQAKAENKDNFVNNTVGIVFYSCPHFGSKLADMPWRMGLVLRPAPTIGELRSGSPRLTELNDFVRRLYKRRLIDVLSFCETKVTPIVEGYGGWAFRMEIVPMESAYPGFGELVVLDSTDHVNSCKPLSRADPSYKDTLEFLKKLRSHYSLEGSVHNVAALASETESDYETEEVYSSTEEYSDGEEGPPPNGQTPPPVKRRRRRYRKQSPGESKGITEEMRFVNGDGGGETWQPSIEGFSKYLVDSKLVFSTVERIVDETTDVSYVYFRRTGLERSDCISRDLEWLREQGNEIPEPSNPGVTYAQYLEELAEKSPPLFLCHFYNIYFSHIAGGQVIARKVSDILFGGRELEMCKWEGDAAELLRGVREKLNALGEHWSRDEKNRCLRETTKAFRFLGQIMHTLPHDHLIWIILRMMTSQYGFNVCRMKFEGRGILNYRTTLILMSRLDVIASVNTHVGQELGFHRRMFDLIVFVLLSCRYDNDSKLSCRVNPLNTIKINRLPYNPIPDNDLITWGPTR